MGNGRWPSSCGEFFHPNVPLIRRHGGAREGFKQGRSMASLMTIRFYALYCSRVSDFGQRGENILQAIEMKFLRQTAQCTCPNHRICNIIFVQFETESWNWIWINKATCFRKPTECKTECYRKLYICSAHKTLASSLYRFEGMLDDPNACTKTG